MSAPMSPLPCPPPGAGLLSAPLAHAQPPGEGAAAPHPVPTQPGGCACGEQRSAPPASGTQPPAMATRAALSAWALLASLALAGWGVRGQKIFVKEVSGKVFLECVRGQGDKNITWWKDGNVVGNGEHLDLSAVYDDPRGLYTCDTGKSRKSLQVHYRMCQNCIEVDAPTISGIVIADMVATLFLAVAVYCITGHDRGHSSRASDRQNLLSNELYQPLGEREDEQYSRLAPARARK